MTAANHFSPEHLLRLLVLAGVIVLAVLPATGAAMRISNMSCFPDTIHSGDLANFTVDVSYTSLTSSNARYHFSSGFQNPAWDYQVWVNDQFIQSGRVMGNPADSLSSDLYIEENDRVRLHIEVTETAPAVFEETLIPSIEVTETDETGYEGVWAATRATVYPIPGSA